MLEWLHDEDVTRYLRLNGKASTIEDVRAFIEAAQDETIDVHRAIIDANDDYLGTVSLKSIDHMNKAAEYAISMHASAIGTGAARIGSLLIIALAFDELGLTRVYLNVSKENARAVRFYDKLGFTYTNTTQTIINGSVVDLLWYEVVKGVTELH